MTSPSGRSRSARRDSAERSVLSRIEEHMARYSPAPTARGLADAVGSVIREGILVEGDRLPPIRTAAVQLGLSPTTVSAAWAVLQRAGMVQSRGRNGTRVAPRQAGPLRYRSALTRSDHRSGFGAADPDFAIDLSTGTPDRSLLPSLADALAKVRPPREPSSYLDDPVLPELADLLYATWPFPAERIAVVDGAMDALDLIATTFLRFGDRVAVEDPCFPPLLDLFEAIGAKAVPLPMDEEGPDADALRTAVADGVRAVFLQPRGQNPTGVSMTPSRAAELVEILFGSGILVVEDDSLGAISASPDVSLGGELPTQTLHVRSYSKSHGPDLRLAALGGPARLVEPLVDRRFLGQGWTSRLLQHVLVTMLTDGAAVAAVEAARSEYARRRWAVVERLAAAGVPVPGSDGLNIWVPVADETAALLYLASHGIGASAGTPFQVDRSAGPHLRVTAGLIGAGGSGIGGAGIGGSGAAGVGDGEVAGVIAAAARAARNPAAR